MFSMRKLCPNLDREDGLETVLEVPIPEEMFGSPKSDGSNRNIQNSNSWKTMKTWMRFHIDRSSSPLFGGRNTELQLLLGVIGAPLVPLPVQSEQSSHCSIKDHPIESSTAKYIVQQYIAATGGQKVLSSVKSMYAMGKVEMMASEFHTGNKIMKARNGGKGGEIGGFVLWQKNPDLWCLELVVSGCKISAGSDGKVAWRQTPWHHSHASRGPPRPLRRSLQGLDPRSTADLFSNAICIGEKSIKNDDCFILKLEADPSTLKARSSNNVEIIRHTVWGYFSQRTGLLVQFEDSHLLRIKGMGDESVYWETTMESQIEDYRHVDGINIAHGGRTDVSLFRFGETAAKHTRTKMEERWTIEEVDFNIWGLSMDCFLPPADLKKEQDGYDGVVNRVVPLIMPPSRIARIGSSKVVAIDIEEDLDDEDDEESYRDV